HTHTRTHTHDKQASLKDPAHCSLGDLISCPVLLRPTQQLTSHPVLPEIATAAGGHDCQDGCVIRPSLVPALLLPISLSLSLSLLLSLSFSHLLTPSLYLFLLFFLSLSLSLSLSLFLSLSRPACLTLC